MPDHPDHQPIFFQACTAWQLHPDDTERKRPEIHPHKCMSIEAVWKDHHQQEAWRGCLLADFMGTPDFAWVVALVKKKPPVWTILDLRTAA
ncbi:hypothetical protein L6Q85_12565 [bacterium]|nr:hypothetical protein [bacterium]